MEGVLVVSSKQAGLEQLTELARQAGWRETVCARSSKQARDMLLCRHFALAVVNAPLADDSGLSLAERLLRDSPTQVLLIVKPGAEEFDLQRLMDQGALIVEKPVSQQILLQSLRAMYSSRQRFVSLQQENLRLQEKIDEMKLIDRAKCALIQYLNMTETQAHHYLEKQAMDLRLSKRQVAQSIIGTYEVQ